jgi:hypothetical protein
VEYFSAMATVIPILLLTVFTVVGRFRLIVEQARLAVDDLRGTVDARDEELADLQQEANIGNEDERKASCRSH